jgi:hypothetical protein
MPYEWIPDTPRVFNLGLRERVVDHDAKTVSLFLASDEALLMDYATLVEDTGARAYETSLRAVCNYVLGKIGATLDPAGPDVDVTATFEITNYVNNPVADTTAGFVLGTNATGLGTDNTAGAILGSTAVLFRAIAAPAVAYLNVVGTINVSPGDLLTASAYLSTPHGCQGAVMIRFYDADGAALADRISPPGTIPNTWLRKSLTTSAPAGAARASMFVRMGPLAANNALRVDAPMMYLGGELVAPFSGSTPADPLYTYAWQGVVNASPSTRTPAVDRPPELFVWKPGVTGWDLLEPLTSQAGFRLFCDELRVWRLVDPAEYVVDGFVVIHDGNATDGTDTISREDAEVFATGVVVTYLWEDSTGTARVQYDTAGTPDKVVVIEYRRPYPGPGAAAKILARRNGSGRVEDVTALVQWEATPGMVASITLPVTPNQSGKVDAVTFALDDTALMDLATRGLIDIPADSWLAVNPGEAWTDPPDISWNEW